LIAVSYESKTGLGSEKKTKEQKRNRSVVISRFHSNNSKEEGNMNGWDVAPYTGLHEPRLATSPQYFLRNCSWLAWAIWYDESQHDTLFSHPWDNIHHWIMHSPAVQHS